MDLFAWIFTGVVVGWVAGKALQGKNYVSARDFIMGVGGAAAGVFLTNTAGIPGYPRVFLSTLLAMVCAVLMTSHVAMADGRRILAYNLDSSSR
jgi:uncharacterized membrane protein YeaQ/YmgE (transglycosylase-associated protein family)